MKTLVAVGACCIDVILSVDHYPTEDAKIRASRLVRRRGGNAPNTLEVLQQFPLFHHEEHAPLSPLVLCAVLPARASPATREIESSFSSADGGGDHAARVDLSRCVYREESVEPVSSYILLSGGPTASRTIVSYNALPEMTRVEFVAVADQIGNGAGWYHFEGRIPDVTLECIRYLRDRFPAVRISVEVEKPGRAGLQDLTAEADVVFYSKAWAMANGYHSPEECLRAQSSLTLKASSLFCTWGPDGSSGLELPSQTYTHRPGYIHRDLPVVDTVGAGDTFIASVLHDFLDDETRPRSMAEKLERANELAGRKVVQEGFGGLVDGMREDHERLELGRQA